MAIEKDEIFELAFRYVEHTGTSVFLTGKAGTGKTTFLKELVRTTSKRFVVLAPTGVAAINAGGQTIHSFFLLPLCPYLPEVKELVTEYQMPEKHSYLKKEKLKIIRTLDLLIIDEISMVRADLLDAVDMMLRRYRHCELPFGGVQLLMIGDAMQLAPVVKDEEWTYMSRVYPSPYFFCSKAVQKLGYVTIELQKVFRQQDAEFLDILNAIRTNTPSQKILARLNERVGAECCAEVDKNSDPIRLMTHVAQVERFNRAKMDELPGEDTVFGAEVEGEFSQNNYPVEENIALRKGAQVMFVRNDSAGQYYNGKIGIVKELRADGSVDVECDEGQLINAGPVCWENVQYSLDGESGDIRGEVVGKFKQIPLRPAWAITIHKSQGLTFDKVIIDAGAAFAFGQVYVALSRCRTLEGLSLASPIYMRTLHSDEAVAQFSSSFPEQAKVSEALPAMERRFEFDSMRSVFDLSEIGYRLGRLTKEWMSNLKKIYQTEAHRLNLYRTQLNEMIAVAGKFQAQLSRLEAGAPDDSLLDERLRKAAAWYYPGLDEMRQFCGSLYELTIDNKEVKKKVKAELDELNCQLNIACRALEMIKSEAGFSTEGLARIRTGCITADTSVRKRQLKKVEAPGSVNEELRDALQAWRSAKFKEENVPAYRILMQTTLMEIATRIPHTLPELLAIKGIGDAKAEKYGEEILEICRGFYDVA